MQFHVDLSPFIFLILTVLLMFLSFTGDGMNAYVAYKVSTRVCSKATVDIFANLSKSSVFSQSLWLIGVTSFSVLAVILAHVQE